MDYRVNTLNKHVRNYDQDLFLKRDSFGVIHLYRKKREMKFFEHDDQKYGYSCDNEQYIMSLTRDWKASNRGVDWGIEPLMRRISEIDSWRDDTGYDQFCKHRELHETYKKQSLKNELRARASDIRSDFARATNDVTVRAGQNI